MNERPRCLFEAQPAQISGIVAIHAVPGAVDGDEVVDAVLHLLLEEVPHAAQITGSSTRPQRTATNASALNPIRPG